MGNQHTTLTYEFELYGKVYFVKNKPLYVIEDSVMFEAISKEEKYKFLVPICAVEFGLMKKSWCFGYGYIGSNGRGYLHRLIAQNFIKNENPETHKSVDHLNKNKLDNRLENLRWADFFIQLCNQKKRKNCSSQFKYVCKNKYGKFSIGFGSKTLKKEGIIANCKQFDSELECAKYATQVMKQFQKPSLEGIQHNENLIQALEAKFNTEDKK
jgi:hypothetical protein